MQSLDELRELRKNFPELWEKLLYWESKTYNNFRSDYSLPQLEIRFDLEQEWMKLGKIPSMRNKKFVKQLNEKLEKNQWKST